MLFRMPQDCSHVKTFCAEVTEGIDLLLKTNMPWDPLIFILGLAEDSQGLSSTHRRTHTHTQMLLLRATLIAKRIIQKQKFCLPEH